MTSSLSDMSVVSFTRLLNGCEYIYAKYSRFEPQKYV